MGDKDTYRLRRDIRSGDASGDPGLAGQGHIILPAYTLGSIVPQINGRVLFRPLDVNLLGVYLDTLDLEAVQPPQCKRCGGQGHLAVRYDDKGNKQIVVGCDNCKR